MFYYETRALFFKLSTLYPGIGATSRSFAFLFYTIYQSIPTLNNSTTPVIPWTTSKLYSIVYPKNTCLIVMCDHPPR